MYLYIDGVEQAQTLSIITIDVNDFSIATIGRTYGDFDERGWRGEIDEMRFEKLHFNKMYLLILHKIELLKVHRQYLYFHHSWYLHCLY